MSDEKSLLELRNDPETYRWFLSPEIVDPSDHHEWVKNRYLHHRALTLVLDMEGTVIGTGYLNDLGGDRAEVSIRISSKYRNRGFAKRLLKTLIQRAKESNFDYLAARLHEDNESSINLFSKANFKFVEDAYSIGWLNVEKPFKLMVREINS